MKFKQPPSQHASNNNEQQKTANALSNHRFLLYHKKNFQTKNPKNSKQFQWSSAFVFYAARIFLLCVYVEFLCVYSHCTVQNICVGKKENKQTTESFHFGFVISRVCIRLDGWVWARVCLSVCVRRFLCVFDVQGDSDGAYFVDVSYVEFDFLHHYCW